MNMEVLAVQNQYPGHFALATDWKSQLTLSNGTSKNSLKSQPTYKFKTPHHINHHQKQKLQKAATALNTNTTTTTNTTINNFSNNPLIVNQKNTSNSSNKLNCDTSVTIANNDKNASTIWQQATQTPAVQHLSVRLLSELRAAKSCHLACTEVSLPCDLTPRIALKILKLTAQEQNGNGLRDCCIYIEFEDEPGNSRRIATLDFTTGNQAQENCYEIYVTLRQDYRGWTALMPQFIKNLSRTITISPDFSITKHKPYSK